MARAGNLRAAGRSPGQRASLLDMMMKTLFLHPPSFAGFDGGAGSRYQARREIRSFWYPTWLAQPAALVAGSRLLDAPPAGLALEQVLAAAEGYELCVMHTSTPSFGADLRVAERLKEMNPGLLVGFVGAHVAVDPEAPFRASRAVDFVGRNEFDFTIKDVAEGRPLGAIDGLSHRHRGRIVHNRERAVLEDMDRLPFVVDVYKRDLRVEDYFIGYLLHPYVSLYTGRGCRSRCTFCLWPQTVGGHRYRTRSAGHVAEEITLATRYFPQVKEYFFDDDTFTDDLARAETIARRLGRLGVTWSCNAKANVPYATLKVLKDNGLRLLLVGYESGSQQILNNVRKGIRLEGARRFTRDCHALGITIHGTFVLGLPGESRETIQETIRFAADIDPHTIQVSIAAPYPGTLMYRQAVDNGWLQHPAPDLVDRDGVQVSALSYPHLAHTEIFESVETFYRRFYFRPRKIISIASEMARSPQILGRRLREGLEFARFLRARRTQPE
jgi:hopanoid biosynthesis associated radical SAM protein HpnJ